MGIDKALFLEPPPCDLVCALCHDALDDPVQVYCAEDHIFCLACIVHYGQQATGGTCPTCQTPMHASSFQPSKFVQRQLTRLTIYCIYKDAGCHWTGPPTDTQHRSQCSFRLVPCPNAQHGCTANVEPSAMAEHDVSCEFRQLGCPNGACNAVFLQKDMSQHEMACRSYPCAYRAEGCSFVGNVAEVRQHDDAYCGRLHHIIRQLEDECHQLRLQLGQQPQLSSSLNASQEQQTQQQPLEPALTPSSGNTTLATTPTPLTPQQQQGGGGTRAGAGGGAGDDAFMNWITQTDVLQLFDQPVLIPDARHHHVFPPGDPQLPPMSAMPPKRTAKGNRIRYNKNTGAAHTAMRASKSASTLTNAKSPKIATPPPTSSIDDTNTTTTNHVLSPAIMSIGTPVTTPTADDLAGLMGALNTNTTTPVSSPFHSLDDVAKFLEEAKFPLAHAASPTTLLPTSPGQGATTPKKKLPRARSKKQPRANANAHHQPASPTPSSGPASPAAATDGPKPLFHLASSYLAKQGS
ncbi:hypothetical protein BC940DRAFT_366576 [Gongronella butleri]|nr:hypothetical protein BC940DRAFT_366576 [Gongronella butleri]